MTHLLLRKLNSIATLDREDQIAVDRLPLQLTDLKADQDIVREGDRPMRSCFLLSGMACWFKLTGEGRRQIFSFQISGRPSRHAKHPSCRRSTAR